MKDYIAEEVRAKRITDSVSDNMLVQEWVIEKKKVVIGIRRTG